MTKTNPIYNGYYVRYQIEKYENILNTETLPHRVSFTKKMLAEAKKIEKKYFKELKQELGI